MKPLHLTLHKKWFQEILKGTKKEEYREIKPYWEKRLFNNNKPIPYKEIIFRNGYNKNSPQMRIECKNIKKGKDNYIIQLGNILETKNVE